MLFWDLSAAFDAQSKKIVCELARDNLVILFKADRSITSWYVRPNPEGWKNKKCKGHENEHKAEYIKNHKAENYHKA